MVIAKGIDPDTGGYVHVLIGEEWPKDHVQRNAIIENAIELIEASRDALTLIELVGDERDPFAGPRLRKVLSKLKFIDSNKTRGE